MEILTIKEASNIWGISARRISVLCQQGRIPGAVKMAGVWLLPANSKKPKDARVKSGNYVNWRKHNSMTCANFESNLKNLRGTFAAEGMEISDTALSLLERLAFGESSCAELVEELKEKYRERV